MKKIFTYFCLLSTLLLAGCSDELPVKNYDSHDEVTVTSRCIAMNPYRVGTKATQKEPDETKVTQQHIFIFGTDRKLLKVTNAVTNFRSESFQTSHTGSFVINRTFWAENAKSNASSIYVLANVDIDDFVNNAPKANGQLDITEDNLLDYCASTFNQSAKFDPNVGMPMFGKYEGTLDLRNGQVQAETYNVTLIPLLARIDVKINFKPVDRNPDNAQFPAFQLINYDILNMPKSVKLRDPSGDTPDGIELFDVTGQANGAKTLLRDQSTSFTFYVGEYWRSKAEDFSELDGYPANFDSMTESEQQRYKQKNKNRIAPEDALKLVLHGIYTTPEGQGLSVDYTICLGGNLTDDFKLKRNYIYKNEFDIKGYVERINGTNGIEVDHRVKLEYQKYYIQSERRTEIDCHWEMRPVDIAVTNPKTTVTAQILDEPDWLGIEQKMDDSGDDYLNGGNGRRKYFTKSLVSDLNAASREFTITPEDNRLWLYFDENRTVSETGSRQCTVRFTFEDEEGTEEIDMVFVQHDACPVEFTGSDGKKYEYVMETHEEYLYNFDPKDNYGVVTDGMPWGYDGVQISKQYKAISDFKSWISNNSVDVANLAGAYYDFDNRSDAPFKSRMYSGKDFTKELISLGGDYNYSIPAENGVPRSAAEYCYNKNYRNSDGNVTDADYEWYLPAVDEIEPLLISGFNSFPELQNNYYWSSQPSYLYMDVLISRDRYLSFILGTEEKTGEAFIDDTDNARATKITKATAPMSVANSTKKSKEGQIYIHLNSNSSLNSWAYRYDMNGNKVNTQPEHSLTQIPRVNTATTNMPNQARNSINRVRCVRRIEPQN